MPGDSPLSLDLAELTDLGMRRANNQDALTTVITDDAKTWKRRGHFLMVADGMGAHAAGELASKLAIDNIPHSYYKSEDSSPATALRCAVRAANDLIHGKGQTSIDFLGMGTTCTCLAILPQGALVAHVGDSRAYRLRGDVLEQLSFDHSLVWEAKASGQVADEKLLAALPKNVITRSLGPHAVVNIDLEGPFPVFEDDIYLVCSDGLSGQVNDVEIGTILGCLPPEEAAQMLIDLANLRGGPDNISIVIGKVAGTSAAERERGREFGSDAKTTLLIWLVAIASFLAMCGTLSMQLWWPALLSGVAFCAAVAIAAVKQMNGRDEAATPMPGSLGEGPYRKYECKPDLPVVEALADQTRKLRELSDDEELSDALDWSVVESHQQQAEEATKSKDFCQAVIEYSLAIRYTMKKLRERRNAITTKIDFSAQKPE